MTAAVTEAKGSEAAEEKTLFVTPLNTLQLDMVTKFYQHVQLTKTTALADADVMKLTEDDHVVCNGTPIDWCCKNQNRVEGATHGSEFQAAKTAVEQIVDHRTTLRCLGVPLGVVNGSDASW